MPNIKNHVPTLENSKRLNELLIEKGYEVPESLFYWIKGEMEYGYEGEWHINEVEGDKYFIFTEELGRNFEDYDFKPNTCEIGDTDEQYLKWDKETKAGLKRMRKAIYPAYLSSELGSMLPYKINHEDTIGGWYLRTCRNIKLEHLVTYIALPLKITLHAEFADTEQDARCLMLIYLLEQGLPINLKKSNE